MAAVPALNGSGLSGLTAQLPDAEVLNLEDLGPEWEGLLPPVEEAVGQETNGEPQASEQDGGDMALPPSDGEDGFAKSAMNGAGPSATMTATARPRNTKRRLFKQRDDGLEALAKTGDALTVESLTVAGNGAATARVLKDLGKSMTRSTAMLRKTVEQVRALIVSIS